MGDSYVLKENDFRMELEIFWDSLNKTEDVLGKDALAAAASEKIEISSNHIETAPLSPVEESHVPDSAYSQDETESVSKSSVQHVGISESESLEFGVPEPAGQMMKRESVDLSSRTEAKPESQPEPQVTPSVASVAENVRVSESPAMSSVSRSQTPSASIVKNMAKPRVPVVAKVSVSGGVSGYTAYTIDRGFTLWTKNNGQTLYTNTELYCTKTFGGDTKKLRRYLVAKGGFSDKQIKNIRKFQIQDRETQKMVYHARVIVNGTKKSIQAKIDKLENQRDINKKRVIWISRIKQNLRCNKLMVRNFDILSGNDRQRMTQMFSRIGPLDAEVRIGRDRDGINFAVVTFRDQDTARMCERNQNDSWWRQDMRSAVMCFNGRVLQVGYADNKPRNVNNRKMQRKSRKGKW